MLENDFIKGKTYFISNRLAKQMNNNFLNVHDSLELMLYVYSRVKETSTNIDISYGLYNFIELKELQHHLEANNLTRKMIVVVFVVVMTIITTTIMNNFYFLRY